MIIESNFKLLFFKTFFRQKLPSGNLTNKKEEVSNLFQNSISDFNFEHFCCSERG